jgi:hypothetical protein
MIFHPAIMALLVGSLLVTLMLLYSSYYGVQVIRKWDIKSGSELQLCLERRTYLVSIIMSYMLFFQLASFYLFIFTADAIHATFVSAMCAAGSLNVNEYGYPAVIIKMVNFLVAGTWLIINYADNRAYDYPLIKKKYLLLLVIAPLMVAELIVQGAYFIGLKANVITSCCGSLFSADAEGIASEIAALPRLPMKIAFYLSTALTLASGMYFCFRSDWSGYVFSFLSIATFVVSVAAMISFISLYFYELPTHHCPFCILQKDYGFIGYLLYIALFGGAVSGLGTGALMPFRKIQSLSQIVPSIQRRLAFTALILYFLFTVVVTYRMIFSDFILEGY